MGKDLSDDQVSSMKEAFMLFDTDNDGKIAPSELGILMRSLGGNPTQAQLKSIVAEEKLTAPFNFPRFLELMAKHMKPEPFDRQLRDSFKVLDKDSTGFVSVSELRHILTNIGEKLEPSEFDEWIREVDVGSDGKIKYEDFIARMLASSNGSEDRDVHPSGHSSARVDVFIYAFESVHIVNKWVYPTSSLHFPAWEFLNTSFLASTVRCDVDTILCSPITLLTSTFVRVSLCAMDTFLRMLGQAPKWEFLVSRKRSHVSGPRAIFQGRFLCCHIQQLFFGDDHNLQYFPQWDWLQLHFLLGNTFVVQHVLSSKQIFATKAELMALAHHEQQNGLSLSSKNFIGQWHSENTQKFLFI
ncbi:hypothetical protein DVH24_036022 [Malus domestica]|uniref:EF-hand domain-containing protein n=1 Tax=Malus domestica TaxID=3750 RepID=A0A498JU59_MALDO|nr:hypothetical protein DVH24_036022 [Malus domestica]